MPKKQIDWLLDKLGLMRKAEAEQAIKVFKQMADRDSRFAASLVEECDRLLSDNDEMADEIGKLHEEIDHLKARYSM